MRRGNREAVLPPLCTLAANPTQKSCFWLHLACIESNYLGIVLFYPNEREKFWGERVGLPFSGGKRGISISTPLPSSEIKDF
jgi:hypothetical protein